MIIINYDKQNYIIDNDINIKGKDKTFVSDLKIIVDSILFDYNVSKGFKASYIAEQLKTDYKLEVIYIDDEEMEKSTDNVVY